MSSSRPCARDRHVSDIEPDAEDQGLHQGSRCQPGRGDRRREHEPSDREQDRRRAPAPEYVRDHAHMPRARNSRSNAASLLLNVVSAVAFSFSGLVSG